MPCWMWNLLEVVQMLLLIHFVILARLEQHHGHDVVGIGSETVQSFSECPLELQPSAEIGEPSGTCTALNRST